jgi:hypothetical protein
MHRDLLPHWREDIVGDWRAELDGVDLLYLEPVASKYSLLIILKEDGTADYQFTLPHSPARPTEPSPPFPTSWELSDDRILSIWIPIAPMPEYEMPDWSREQICYDVLSVTDLSLSLSNRRFDGEEVIVLRRINDEQYRRRKAEEYGQILKSVNDWVKARQSK